MHKLFYTRAVIILSILSANSVLAGPPFLTDDPVPVEYKHYEIIPFISSDNTQTASNIQGPAVEVDYGLLNNLEINITIFADANIAHQQDEPGGMGIGDIELGMTYRFIQETAHIPQVGFTPGYFIPSGDSNRQLGNGRPYIILPLWAQKSFGPWTTYGGGGYTWNPAPDKLNNFYGGWLVQKDLNTKWTLGGELFIQGATDDNTPTTYIINLGGNYNITKEISVIFSSGHSVKGGVHFVTYIGLDVTI